MTSIDRRGLAAFLGVAFGGAWLADLGLVLTGGVAGSSGWLIYVAMAAPAAATFVVSRYVSPTACVGHDTGLILGRRGSGWVWHWLFGWLGVAALASMGPFVGALLWVQSLDLVTLSGAPSVLGTLLPGVPLGSDNGRTLVWIILATLPLQALPAAPVVWLEEWGWRGYQLPSLLPLGTWPAPAWEYCDRRRKHRLGHVVRLDQAGERQCLAGRPGPRGAEYGRSCAARARTGGCAAKPTAGRRKWTHRLDSATCRDPAAGCRWSAPAATMAAGTAHTVGVAHTPACQQRRERSWAILGSAASGEGSRTTFYLVLPAKTAYCSPV